MWGQAYLSSNGVYRVTQIPVPLQVCRETNWAAFEKGFGFLAWTTSGELWQLSLSYPNADASIASNSRLILTNSRPGHFASAMRFTGNPTRQMVMVFYQVHADSTLWECDSPPAAALPTTWHQVGTRSDWLSIWGGGGTALGLTRDGTIWTWGVDWSQKPEIPFSVRWQILQDRVAKLFKPTAGSGGIGPIPAYQELPRPLIRMVTAGTNQSGNSITSTNSKLSDH